MQSAPDPVDPYEQAAAQGSANRGAAIASSLLNNPAESSPFGSLSYRNIGWYTGKDEQGERYRIPLRERVITLSPAEQQKLNLQNQLQTGLLGLGNRQIGQVGQSLRSPFSLRGMPQAVNKIGSGPDLQSSVDYLGPLMSIGYNGPGVTSSYASGGDIQKTIGPGAALQGTYASGGPVKDFQSTAGAVGRLGDDALPKYLDTYAPEGGFSEDRRRVEEALLSRVNPQLEQQRAQEEARLTAQGLQRGTPAFEQAMNSIRQQQNDAYFQSVLAGGQEQSRLLGEARSAAEFTNEARGQSFADRAAQFGLNLGAQGQEFQQGIAGWQANLAAQAQRNQQAREAAGFWNETALSGSQRDIALMQARNAAQAQAESQNASRAGFANDAQAQAWQQAMQQAGFSQEAIQLANQQRMQNAALRNATMQQEYQNRQTGAAWQNDARSRAIQEALLQRTQPLNEVSAFMSGGQVNVPQFSSLYRPNIDPAPIGQYMTDAYTAEANAAAQANQGMFGLAKSLIGLPFAFMGMSDRRVKREITQIGATDRYGIPVYTFRYLWDEPEDPIRIGVIADEVKTRVPDAVRVISGIEHVDYSRIL